MSILYSLGDEPFLLPETMAYDINEKKFYSMSYRPISWSADTEYKKDIDVIMASVPNGLYYECTSGGISGSIEPAFNTSERDVTNDGTVEWITRPYDLLLNTGDVIIASTWVGTNGETIDNESIVSSIHTKFRLTAVAADSTEVTIVNHITVTRLNGDDEELDRSIIIPVKPL